MLGTFLGFEPIFSALLFSASVSKTSKYRTFGPLREDYRKALFQALGGYGGLLPGKMGDAPWERRRGLPLGHSFDNVPKVRHPKNGEDPGGLRDKT